MKGIIDDSGRALIQLKIGSDKVLSNQSFDAWIDTGFTGDLVLPQKYIDQLKLKKSGSVDAVLADGSLIRVNTYSCCIEWFGKIREMEVIANEGTFPLLGIGLLMGFKLILDYQSMTLEFIN